MPGNKSQLEILKRGNVSMLEPRENEYKSLARQTPIFGHSFYFKDQTKNASHNQIITRNKRYFDIDTFCDNYNCNKSSDGIEPCRCCHDCSKDFFASSNKRCISCIHLDFGSSQEVEYLQLNNTNTSLKFKV